MRLSVQLYTVRDHLAQDWKGTLQKIRALGIEYVEIAGMADRSADEWKNTLDELGLKASGSHIGVGEFAGKFDEVVNTAKTLGFDLVIVPWVGEDQYGAGWDKFAQQLEPIARKLKEQGLQLAYHNHAFEFEKKDGKLGLDLFYETAPADLVHAELDLAWIAIGGGDPVAYIQKLGSRVGAVHLKDYDPSAKPQWVPAGTGKVDLKACVEAADAAGVKFGVIELDESPGDSLEAVRQSAEYLKGLGVR
jgi:sugar phosphate isomerase/epimerase